MKTTADVVIIGGGCMGASVAYYLARCGITNISLIEKEPMLGMGSTGRNAGGVRHQFSAEVNVRLSIESIATFERFKEEVGAEIDFHQDGYLFLLSREQDVSTFRGNVDMQRRLGVDVSLISAEDAEKLAPGLSTSGVLAATYCARDGICDPNGVTMGFARAARSMGAEINCGTEVTAIKVEAGRVAAVDTDRGTISTQTVVNAAGPFAGRIGAMTGLDIPISPYRRHIFITEPIAEHPRSSRPATAGQSGMLPSSRIMVIDFESTFYFHREGQAILFGMADLEEPPSYSTTVNWGFLERLTNVAVKRLPGLADLGIAHAWAGLYEVTPDAMPIIGPAWGPAWNLTPQSSAADPRKPSHPVEGIYLIAGFSGHGFQHSPAAGRILAETIAYGQPRDFDLSPFSLNRFTEGSHEPEGNVV